MQVLPNANSVKIDQSSAKMSAFAVEESNEPHTFNRDKTCCFCFICQNWWPESNAAVTKYYCCHNCGVGVHAECRYLAQRCYPCVPGKDHAKTMWIGEEIRRSSGRLFCQVLQAYDLQISSGTYIYGLCKFPGGKEAIKTESMPVGEGDCVWASNDIKTGVLNESQPLDHADDGCSNSLEWVSSSSCSSIEPLDPAQNRCSIAVEIWSSSIYGMFDTVLMHTNISLIPLLRHPNVTVERWFPLHQLREKACKGTVLVRLVFVSSVDRQKAKNLKFKNVPIFSSEVKAAQVDSVDHSIPDETDRGGASMNFFAKNMDYTKSTVDEVSISETNRYDIIAAEIPGPEPAGAQSPAESDQTANSPCRNNPVSRNISNPESSKTVSKWLSSTVVDSAKSFGEGVSSFVWAEYRIPKKKTGKIADNLSTVEGTRAVSIGKVNIQLIDAYRTDVADAAEGDYFASCAVVDSKGTVRHNGLLLEEDTQMIYNSAAPAFNCFFEFDVPHFRCGVKFVLIDGSTGRKVGSSYISVYSLIQRDIERSMQNVDSNIRIIPFPSCFNRSNVSTAMEPSAFLEKKHVDTFILSDITGQHPIGHFTAKVAFQENIEELFLASTPKLAGVSPDESVSVDRLRTHIDRFKDLVDLFNTLSSEHKRIMEWEEPGFTMILLMAFLYTTLFVSAEYALSIPLFVVVVLMTKMWYYRTSGGFKKRIIENDAVTELVPYRPLAILRVAVCDFSKHFAPSARVGEGYPLPQFTKITYAPSPNLTKKNGSNNGNKFDNSELSIALAPVGQRIQSIHRSGSSGAGSTGFSQLLSNLNIIKSDILHDGILHNNSDPWPRLPRNGDIDISYVYPILQPDVAKDNVCKNIGGLDKSGSKGDDVVSTGSSRSKFQPWSSVNSEIKFTFFGDSPELSFVDSTLGSISIPVRQLAESNEGLQPELCCWFPIQWNNSFSNHSKTFEDGDPVHGDSAVDVSDSKFNNTGDACVVPSVLLRLQLDIRGSPSNPSEVEIEKSRAVQSILLRNDENTGGTISTLWNMPEHVRHIQNLMGSILNSIESFKNIFNWTIPSKTNLVYWSIVLIWIISVIVPGRYLLLFGGLYDFFYFFMPQPEDFPFDTRFRNLLEAIPNDDDLRQVYEDDRKAHSGTVSEAHRVRLKKARLGLFFDCIWNETVKLKDNSSELHGDSRRGWQSAHLALQGHRLVWWKTEEDINDGNAPIGQLLLFGHAGVSHPSPLDIKEMGDDGRLLCIFGRDLNNSQRKITIVCDVALSCQTLAAAVNKILLDS